MRLTTVETTRRTRTRQALPALAAGMMIGYLGGGLLPELVRGFRSALDLSVTSAGAVATVMLLATALAGMAIAHRTAQPGRARLAMIGAAVAAVGYVLAGLAPSLLWLFAAAAAAGAGSGVTLSAATSALAAMPDTNRASGLAIIANTFIAAALLAILPTVGGGSLLSMMVILAVVCVVGMVFLRWLPDSAVDVSQGPTAHVRFGMVLIGGTLLFRVMETGIWAFTDDVGVDVVAMSDSQMGVLLSVTAMAALLGAGLQIVVGKRFGHFLPIVILLIVDEASRTMLLVTDSAAVFITLSLVWWASYTALFAYLLAMSASMDPSGRWAARMAAILVIGDAIGPLVAGWLVEASGLTGLALASVGLGIVSLVMIGFVARALDRVGVTAR